MTGRGIPEHGDRRRYVHGPDENNEPNPCRCTPCRLANNAEASRTYRLKAYGQWQPYVAAAPARRHVETLVKLGIKPASVAHLAGVSVPTVTRLLKGDPKHGVAPPEQIRPATADALLAVEYDPAQLKPAARIDGAGTRRRLQALVAAGWSLAKLAGRVDIDRTNIVGIIRADGVRADTAVKVRAAYKRLWNQPPPGITARDRVAAEKARAWARGNGWPTAAGWDDELIDLPDADFKVEIARRVGLMDEADLRRCYTARYKYGELSPLVAAAAHEWTRRLEARRPAAAREEVAA